MGAHADIPPLTGPLAAPPPAAVAAAGARALTGFEAAAAAQGIALPGGEDWRAAARAVMGASDFVARVARQQPGAFADLLTGGTLAGPTDAAGYVTRLRAQLGEIAAGLPDEAALARALCRFRALGSARIAWRDLAGAAPIEATLAEQSALADACIAITLEILELWARARHGTPRAPDGTAQSLLVLGMGKLGGRELNFSSDIDLIFVFGAPGRTDGARALDHAEYFTRLGQRLIAVLGEATPNGFAFRVDMRLRPFGGSGPLVVHLAQFEQYLLTQAREWERFALVKARPLTGDAETIAAVEELLRPFVFRRYLDFGAFEAIRDLKARLGREVARKGIHGDVKYSPGGIREIEFIVQAFQLIRGGREPRLRARELLAALAALGDLGELSPRTVSRLADAYHELRRVENRLQVVADERVHALPVEAGARDRLAWTMGAAGWPSFRAELDTQMERVHACFRRVFNVPDARTGNQSNPAVAGLTAVWEGELDPETADRRLAVAGFAAPAEVRARLDALRGASRYRMLSVTARDRLDRLMPWLLADVSAAASQSPGSNRASSEIRILGRLLGLIEAVARRSVYLSLLTEHGAARRRLVDLCAASAWIADFVTRHPILLDELIDPEALYEPADRAALGVEIGRALEGIDPADLEAQMDALRQVKQVNVLRVAAADISGRLPLMRVSDYLTATAEAILESVYRLAWEQTARRYGRPQVRPARDDDGEREPGFGIVAYGKLGGIELGYGSDLDLVFLHDGGHGDEPATGGERALDNASFFARLAQRIVHFLNTPTSAGVLYDIDTRLRPNGSAGLLVSPLAAFERYQMEHAWTWEHQALVRARVIVGDPSLTRRFEAIRTRVLQRPRERDALRGEVAAMRERMRRELARDLARERPGLFDLKQGRGGVADIEFMVQYGILAGASATPALLAFTDNIRLLDALAAAGELDADEARLLTDAYRLFRARVHRLALLDEPAVVEADPELAESREAIAYLWARRLEDRAP